VDSTQLFSAHTEGEMFTDNLDHFTGLTFFHPDYTVGPGVPPDPTRTRLRAFTTDRELLMLPAVFPETSSPCPEGLIFTCTQIIKVCGLRVNGFRLTRDRLLRDQAIRKLVARDQITAQPGNKTPLNVKAQITAPLRKRKMRYVKQILRRLLYYAFFNTGRPVFVSSTL
jgi:hypothetical protein